MEKFCRRDITEPPSQGTHYPWATHPLHFFRLRRLRWPERSLELASKRGKKKKTMPVPGFEPRIFSLRVKRCLEGVRGGENMDRANIHP
jgi:hypothetical protein